MCAKAIPTGRTRILRPVNAPQQVFGHAHQGDPPQVAHTSGLTHLARFTSNTPPVCQGPADAYLWVLSSPAIDMSWLRSRMAAVNWRWSLPLSRTSDSVTSMGNSVPSLRLPSILRPRPSLWPMAVRSPCAEKRRCICYRKHCTAQHLCRPGSGTTCRSEPREQQLPTWQAQQVCY